VVAVEAAVGLAEVAVRAGEGVVVAVTVITVDLGEGETPGLGEPVSLGPPQAARTRTASAARLNPAAWQAVNGFAGPFLRLFGHDARRPLYSKISLPPLEIYSSALSARSAVSIFVGNSKTTRNSETLAWWSEGLV